MASSKADGFKKDTLKKSKYKHKHKIEKNKRKVLRFYFQVYIRVNF